MNEKRNIIDDIFRVCSILIGPIIVLVVMFSYYERLESILAPNDILLCLSKIFSAVLSFFSLTVIYECMTLVGIKSINLKAILVLITALIQVWLMDSWPVIGNIILTVWLILFTVVMLGYVIQWRNGNKRTQSKIRTGTNTVKTPAKMQILQTGNASNLSDVVNKTYLNIAMYVRDVNLSQEQERKYSIGSFIREESYVEATRIIAGMATTHRFIILSNHMAELNGQEDIDGTGLCIAQSNSRFKILGKLICKDKEAIVLLHLPYDDSWKTFLTVQCSADKQLLEEARRRFEQSCYMKPFPGLITQNWIDRCASPIGMDNNGVLWAISD